MTSKKLSKQEQDFADAMALKLVLIESKRKKITNAEDLSKNMATFEYRLLEK